MNPYTAALVRHQRATQHLLPPAPASKPAAPERVQAFFDALDIGHPTSKWKVATAVAHTMTKADVAEATRRLIADRDERVNKLLSLDAPVVIIENAKKQHQKALRLLERVV